MLGSEKLSKQMITARNKKAESLTTKINEAKELIREQEWENHDVAV